MVVWTRKKAALLIRELDRVAIYTMAQTDAFGPMFETAFDFSIAKQQPQRCSKPNSIKAAQNSRNVLSKFDIEALWNAV
jgi:hypothetical protein